MEIQHGDQSDVLFRTLDTDGSGTLDLQELKAAITLILDPVRACFNAVGLPPLHLCISAAIGPCLSASLHRQLNQPLPLHLCPCISLLCLSASTSASLPLPSLTPH